FVLLQQERPQVVLCPHVGVRDELWVSVCFAAECTNGLAQFIRSAGSVARPKRQPSSVPRRRSDNDLVTSDVFNPPGRRPEGKYIPHARFVHHLLIKLTHATRRALTTGDEHAKHAAVWNRARIGHRHALRARPRRHYPRDAVVDHARAQLSKIS